MQITRMSLPALAQGLEKGEFSAVEVAGAYLERIQASDLNAFIDVRPELTPAARR